MDVGRNVKGLSMWSRRKALEVFGVLQGFVTRELVNRSGDRVMLMLNLTVLIILTNE